MKQRAESMERGAESAEDVPIDLPCVLCERKLQ